MRKFVFVLCLIMLFTMSISGVSARTPQALGSLARYFPAESPLYFGFRIDDDMIDALDVVLNQVQENSNIKIQEDILRFYLNMWARDIDPDGDFTSVYQSWLGDTMAIGATTPETLAYGSRSGGTDVDTTVLLAVEIENRQRAEIHMDKVVATGFYGFYQDYEKIEVEDAVLYAPLEVERYRTTFLLLDDAMLIRFSSVEPESIIPQYETSLADLDKFHEALARLPEEEYNMVTYYDPGAMAPYAEDYETFIRVNTLYPEEADTKQALLALGAQSVGFTIFDDFALTIDIATHVADPDMLADAGITIIESAPIDLNFAQHVPLSALSFVQDAGVGLGILQVMLLQKSWGIEEEKYTYRRETNGNLFFDEIATTLLTVFIGVQQNLPDAVSGNHLLIANLRDAGPYSDLPDMALLIETPNPILATTMMSSVPLLLDAQSIPYERDDDGLVLSQFAEQASTPDMTMLLRNTDDFIMMGTQPTVTSVLEEDVALIDTEAYQRAAALFIPDPQIVAYFNARANYRVITALLNIYESASFSARYDATGTGHARLVMTIHSE